jgi:integrase/recombinase XerD
MSTPVVTIFVRHSQDCPYKGDEFNKRCRCPKHLRWSHNCEQHRQSAEARTWAEAEIVKRRVEEQFKPANERSLSAVEHKTIQQAIELFVTFKTSEGLDANILKKYIRELGRLRQFMHKRMVFHARDISLEHLTEYRGKWTEQYPSSTTRQKVQERLKAFLRYCYDARWLDRVPSLSPIHADEPPTMPLTDKEYEKLLAQCAKEFQPGKALDFSGCNSLPGNWFAPPGYQTSLPSVKVVGHGSNERPVPISTAKRDSLDTEFVGS